MLPMKCMCWYADAACPSVWSRHGGLDLLIRSVSVCPFSRSLVPFVMARIVLWRLLAVYNS